ncbi:MAG: hypothetical protein C4K60_03020 [Ideonella sp. MAG2]|nr:MAG: hypothetical protein C4K60_03020 [Ideonella sp. MAG2]
MSWSGGAAPRLLLGPWLVDGPAHRLVQGEQRVALEPLHMAVLLALCERVGRVVSADELLAACWRGEPLGDNPVHKAIAALRRALGDSATAPQFIETIRKQGYRLISTVQVLGDQGPRGRTGAWTAGSPFQALLRALVEARLLVTDQVGGRVGFRVAHEALLRRWPRVTTWVAQHQLSLSTRDELHPWVQRWRDEQGASAYLLPQGPLLSRAREGLVTHLELFTEDERQFVRRSVLRHQRKRQWRWAAVAASVALAAVTSWMAVHNLELAHQAQARERESQRLSSFMLGELADQLRPLGKLDLLGSLGAIAIKRARWAEAQQAFEEGRRLAQAALADEPDNAAHESILNETETWLGVVAYVQGQPVKALEWYDGPLKRMAKRASTSGEAALESWIRGGLLRRTADARVAMADRERARQDLQSAAAALSSAWRSEPSNVNWEIHLVIAKAQLALLEASGAKGVSAKLGAVLSELSVAAGRSDSKAEPYGRAKVLLGLLRAKQALETGDASAAIRACDDAKALLDDVYKAAPDWQLDQLRGQLAMIGLAALNALNADAERQRWCEQMQTALAPALASGHAGVVLEASLHLQACTGSRTPTPEDWQRLSAGGYRVVWVSGKMFPFNQ